MNSQRLGVPHIYISRSDEIIQGDCLKVLQDFPADCVDLIMTSPPYSDQRKYAEIRPENYVNWFLPISQELFRVLKPTGSFVLNIKERVVDRSTYVLELILALKKQGWLWTEEYIWHKKNCAPGKWPNRFRDAWERCLHFTKNKKFAMYQDSVMVPVGDWAEKRMKNLSTRDKTRTASDTESGFGFRRANWLDRNMVYPSNVLHLGNEIKNKGHSAVFPEELPEWFIKLFTAEGDLVLDCFCGSGTTCAIAKKLGRNYIGIDKEEEFCKLARERICRIT